LIYFFRPGFAINDCADETGYIVKTG